MEDKGFGRWKEMGLLSLVINSATEGGRRLCFHSDVSLCLFVCEQVISKYYGWIQTKFVG